MPRNNVLMAVIAIACTMMLLVPAFAAVSSNMSPGNSAVTANTLQSPSAPTLQPAYSYSPGNVYVMDENGTLSAVNITGYAAGAHLSLGNSTSPYWAATTPNGTLLLTVDDGTNNVTVTDLSTFTNIGNISTPATPDANYISVNPDGLYAYVSGYQNYNLSVISLSTMQVVKVLTVAYDPNYMALTPNGTLGFALSYSYSSSITHSITVINTQTNSVIKNITSPYIVSPFYGQVSPNGSILAIANYNAKNITLLNTTTFNVTGVIQLPGYPSYLSFSGNGSTLYASLNSSAQTLEFAGINMNTLGVSFTKTFSFLVGSGGSFALSANGTYAYIGNGGNVVPALNLQTLSYANITGFSHTSFVVVPASSFYSTAVFHERGLNPGTAWSITVAGQTLVSTNQTISLTGFTTNYSYTVTAQDPYLYTYSPNGNYILSAASVTNVAVQFYTRFNYSNPSDYAYVTTSVAYGRIGILNLTTLSQAGNISVGMSPYSSAVTPNGTLLLTVEDGSNNVTVTDMKTFTNIASIPTPATPDANFVSINPDGLYAYVAGYLNYKVSVISLASLTVVKVLTVAYDPWNVAISPNGTLGFATSVGTNSQNICVINTATNTVIANISSPYLNSPFFDAVSPNGQLLAVTNDGSNNITLVDTTTFNVIRNVQLLGTPRWLAFSGNGSALYAISVFNGLYTSSNLSIINTQTFSVQSSTVLNSSSLNSFALSRNGSYLYATSGGSLAGVYVVNLNNLTTTSYVPYASPYPIVVPSTAYYNTATFHETGLPAGTAWSVTFAGRTWQSTTQDLSVTGYIGNYNFVFSSSNGNFKNGSGSFVITPASVSSHQVTFTANRFAVTFTESNLPSGTEWFVNISGNSFHSTSSTITVNEPNGTYTYTIGSAGSIYRAAGGTFQVNGSAVSEGVTFSAVTYAVTFTETGLKAGTSWYVVFNGVNRTSTASSITFTSTNGTFSYAIGNESGYKLSASNGTVVVSGAAQSEPVTFTALSSPSSIGGSTLMAIIGGVIIIAVIAGAALFVMRRRRKT